MDKLEKYIQQNKEAFDSSSPPDFIWEQVDKKLESKKHIVIPIKMLKYAAIVVLVLFTGMLIGTKLNTSKPQYAQWEEYKTTENYLALQVNNKYDLLNQKNMLDEQAKSDLLVLDEIYYELKNELIKSNNENSELIINAMIQNYKTKIKILERITEKKTLEESFENLLKSENNENI
jgi:cell division protein FtsB